MIKRFTVFLMALILFTVAIESNHVNVTAKSKKPLVISFMHRNNIGDTSDMDMDAVSSATVYSGPTGEKLSTIEVIRDTVKKEKKAKVFEVMVGDPYSKDYKKTVEQARKEIDDDKAIPLKKKSIPGLKKYKIVYLCVPVWHVTLPQPVKTMLRSNDFSGKTIYVFGAHLGSGFGDIVNEVKKLCPKAKVKAAKTYYGDAKNHSIRESVKKWLKKH